MIHTLHRGLQRLSLLSGLLLLLVGGRLWQVAPPSDTCTVWAVAVEYEPPSPSAPYRPRSSYITLDETGQRLRLRLDGEAFWLKHRAFMIPRWGGSWPAFQLSNRAAHTLKDGETYSHYFVTREPTQGWIYYEREDFTGVTQLYRMDKHGNQQQLVWTLTDTIYASYATDDGRSILYYTIMFDDDGQQQGLLTVVNTLTGSVRVVVSTLLDENGLLTWHTGRREIIYAAGWNGGHFRVSMDGGTPQRLDVAIEYSVIWRGSDQDPTVLYMVHDDDQYSLYRLDWDATTGQRLVEINWEDGFIDFVSNNQALFWKYHWQNNTWTIARLNIDTGEVYDYGVPLSTVDFRWFPDEPRLVFISDEKPPRLMAFYPTTETFETLVTLPSDTVRVGVPPCGKQYWYKHGSDLVLAHLDNDTTTVFPTSTDITPYQWLAFEPPRWHPHLAIGGGLLLSAAGLIMTLWRGVPHR